MKKLMISALCVGLRLLLAQSVLGAGAAMAAMATGAAELGAEGSHLFIYYSDDAADVIGVSVP